jgi:pimeloyl-ACP methyl ester carboxylesterase
LTLRGSLYRHEDRASRGIIVFCHEFGANHWSALSYCEGLWEAGFDILAFDFRNQGESDEMPGYEPIHWLTDYEVQDVLSAVRYIDRREESRDRPIGVFGISRGGCAALAAAALSPRVDCVAAEGAFTTDDVIWYHGQRWLWLYAAPWVLRWIPDWHIRKTFQLARWLNQFRRRCRYTNLRRLLPRLRTRPLLLICGENDKYVFPEIAHSLRRKTGHSENCLWIVPSAKHNMARQVAPNEYDGRLIEFFFDALVADRPAPVRESQPAS